MTTETMVKCPECGEQVDDYLRMAYKRLYDCERMSITSLEQNIRDFLAMRPGREDDEDVAVLALGSTLHIAELADLTRAVRHRMDEEAR